MVVIALVGGRGPLDSGADATVEIQLADNVSVDSARQAVVEKATSSWQAVRVGETSGSDTDTTVEFALPAGSLDGLISELRHEDDAEEVDVDIDLDESQLATEPTTDADGKVVPPEPVHLVVNIERSADAGPWLTIGGAVLVVVLALGAIVFVQRRYGDAEDGAGPPSSPANY